MLLAYCDKIATVCRKALLKYDPDNIIGSVGGINYDLSEEGSFVSTKKTIEVSDMNGKKYLITIEEK